MKEILPMLYNILFGRQRDASALSEKYHRDVKPSRDAAMNVCRDWTNSSCQAAEQLIPMLEKYAKLRALEKSRGIAAFPDNKTRVGYLALEQYRTSAMSFWATQVNRRSLWQRIWSLPPNDISIVQEIAYPATEEMYEFSTFHWSIYMTDRRCTSSIDVATEPPIYDIVRNELHHDDARLQEYTQTVQNQFGVIREKNILYPMRGRSKYFYWF
jgi:hypothetical protein